MEMIQTDLAFVVAMESEAGCVTAHMTDAAESRWYGRRVVYGRIAGLNAALVVSGVGKDNAAAATQLAISAFNPSAIVNVGLAGALNDQMLVGQVCAVEKTVEYDFDLSKVNGTEVGVLNERKDEYIPCAVNSGVVGFALGTADRFTDSDLDVAFLVSCGCELRDMEGAAIAHVCETARVPCRMWKCVSDVFGMESMVGQYKRNAEYALSELKRVMPMLLVDASGKLQNGFDFAHRHGGGAYSTQTQNPKKENAK